MAIGSENELKATLYIKFTVDSASAKIRSSGLEGDEDKFSEVWSSNIPIALKALEPIRDIKFQEALELLKNVKEYLVNNN